jgi:hypothetical protein
MPFSVDTKLGVLLANEKARAVLEKHLPGISTHPQVHLAQGMTLRMIANYPQAGISPEKLQAIDEDLQAIEE